MPDLAVPSVAVEFARAVQAHGGRCFVVGGGVRDRLLGVPVQDWDLEVYGLEPPRLESLISRFGKVHLVGRRIGVYVLRGMEIALPQSGKGELVPFSSPLEASRRRDFTVNALLYDPLTGQVDDFHGGLRDLERQWLRVVDPETFGQDPLRILRAARFHGQLGFRLLPETLAVCWRLAPRLAALPVERIHKELLAWLIRSTRPHWTFHALVTTGAQVLFPCLRALQSVSYVGDCRGMDLWEHTGAALREGARRRSGKKDDDLALMLALLLSHVGRPAMTRRSKDGSWRAVGHERAAEAWVAAFMHRWFAGQKVGRLVHNLVLHQESLGHLHRVGAGAPAYRRLAHRLVSRTLLLAMTEARLAACGRTEPFAENRAALQAWHGWCLEDMPEAWVRGGDVAAMGVPSGPLLGKLVRFAYRWQLVNRELGREALLQLLRERCVPRLKGRGEG